MQTIGIFKLLRFFRIDIKECPVVIQTSVYQIRTPLFYYKLFSGQYI